MPNFVVKMFRLPQALVERQSQNRLLSDLYVTSTGYMLKAHNHYYERRSFDEFTIIYCVEGKGWLQLKHKMKDKTWSVSSGDVIFIPADTPHIYGAAAADPWTIYWAHFQGYKAGPFFDLLGASPATPVQSIGQHPQVIDLFKVLVATLRADQTRPHLIYAASLLRQILSHLLLLNTPNPIPEEESSIAEKIIAFMNENLTQPLRLDDLADRVNLSRSHFSRVFCQQTGFTPIDYFIRLKIHRACELLDSTNLPIGEISRRLGYRDRFYFCRVFKKITGQAPRCYRQQCRQGIATHGIAFKS